jgi:hypothetical protein
MKSPFGCLVCASLKFTLTWLLLGNGLARAGEVTPRRLCVTSAEITDEIADDNPLDTSREVSIHIVAPRNGAASGMVLVHSSTAIAGLAATIGDLHQHGGTAVFPAAQLQVRYAAKEGAKNRFRPDKGMRGEGGRAFYDGLVFTAPSNAPTVPIWVTARVPADAVPGDYEGKLSVTRGTDAPVTVPVALAVCAWKSPDPKDFVSHVGLIESPESVALKYKIPLWSDKHFALIGTVFEHLAQIGNKVLTVSAIENTQLGNYQSMIRFVQDGERLRVDFSVLDRYLEVYAKSCPPPQVFYVYAWDNHFDLDRSGKWRPASVTAVGKGSGKLSSRSFALNTPEAEEYFQQAMDGVRQRARKLGWKDESIMLGTASDSWPSRATTEMFQRVAPYARWVVNSHTFARQINGVEVGYLAYVRAGAKREGMGWRDPRIETRFQRDKHDRECSPGRWRCLVEQALVCGYRGQGRIGADFWHVVLPGGRVEEEMDNRLGCSGWTGNLMLNCSSCALLAPGPDGAVSTARFEALRESLQDCEARIAIEKVLVDAERRKRLGADLVKRCTAELAKRAQIVDRPDGPESGRPWGQLSRDLFNLASEVEEEVGGSR